MATLQKLRKKEREERKQLIINAVLDLLNQKDIQDIKMLDIAERVGVSSASIYRYFPNRDDILVEALILHIKEIKELFVKETQAGRTSLENLALLSVDYLLENNSVFQMMVLMITGQLKPSNLKQYNAMQRDFLDIMEQTSHQVDIGVKKRLVTHAIYASVIGVIMAFKNYPGRSQQEIRDHIYRLVHIISNVFTMNQIQQSFSDIPNSE